jgi:hypothetical protein
MAFPEVPQMTALLAQFKAVFKVGVYLIIAFMVIQLWQDPSGAAHATTNFISGIGHFFASAMDKIGAFVKGLTK